MSTQNGIDHVRSEIYQISGLTFKFNINDQLLDQKQLFSMSPSQYRAQHHLQRLRDEIIRDKRWLTLPSHPYDTEHGHPLMINENEFIFAQTIVGGIHENKGIYNYNATTKHWHKLYEYPTQLNMLETHYSFDDFCGFSINSELSIAMNAENNRLYMSVPGCQLIIFDIKTAKWNITRLDPKLWAANEAQRGGNPNCQVSGDKEYPKLVNVNGTIHLLGGMKSIVKHSIWDNENNCLHKMNDFATDMYDHSLIYVESQKKIFLIGKGIYMYFIETNKWKQIIEETQFNPVGCSAALTLDEEYIIISGGVSKNWKSEIGYHGLYLKDREQKAWANYAFYVLSVRNDNYKLYKSSIHSPKPMPHHIISLRGSDRKDEVFINGWIKWNNLRLLPMEIIQVISIFYSQGIIHWIESEYTGHFVIQIKHILSSLDENLVKDGV
eukprot:401668_1